MKNILLIALLFTCFSSTTQAQINVGSSQTSAFNKAGKLTADDITRLKNTTTLFVLQQRDYEHVADFEKAIAGVWKITKFKIIRREEIEEYVNKGGYSVFSFGVLYKERKSMHGVKSKDYTTTVDIMYELCIPKLDKKGKLDIDQMYARIMMSQDESTVYAARDKEGDKIIDRVLNYIYEDATYKNWGAGFLKGYLLTVNNLLQAEKTRGLYTCDEDGKLLTNLKSDTLYVPDYVNTRIRLSAKNLEEKKAKHEEELRETYPYPIKFISAEQLNEKLMNDTQTFNYLIYTRSNSDKYVTVYNSSMGIAFANYQSISFNFKESDLNMLKNSIKHN